MKFYLHKESEFASISTGVLELLLYVHNRLAECYKYGVKNITTVEITD